MRLSSNSLFGSLAVLLFLSTNLLRSAEVETVAGNGEAGYQGDGGKAIAAQLNQPFGVIVAPDGDIVFCDTVNHVIRRISRKSGKIETLAGTGEAGYSGDGGDPKAAKLFEPYELRYHPNGDLYWVEMKNHLVRKLDARSHTISTVAGTGKSGFSGDGGPAVEATMNRPHSIVFDDPGKSLLICDIGNHRIRLVDLASGTIETWCGNGKREATPDGAKVSPKTPLNGPRAFDRAPNGDLWLALREGNQVFRIDQETETLHHVAGTGKKGFHAEPRIAADSFLSGPKGVAISPDGQQIYLADTESHTVRRIDLTEEPPMLYLVAGDGKKGDGPDSPDPLQCRMARLHGIGTDPVTGDLYIGDSETHKVRKVTGLPGAPDGKRPGLGAYETETFQVGGRNCRVTKPQKPAPGNPWIWRCRFYGAFPAVDEELLARGWHVAWIDVANLFGGPEAMEAFDAFHGEVTKKFGLHPKPVMEGFSRGGLPAIRWAIRRPEQVAGVYLDAPVLSIHSWPKNSSQKLYETALGAYGLTPDAADSWVGPLTQLKPILEKKVPLFLVAGGNDTVVPFPENGAILEDRLREAGHPFHSIVKAGAGHHPHSLHDPAPVVAWAIGLHQEK